MKTLAVTLLLLLTAAPALATEVGATPAEFTLNRLGGPPVSLSDHAGKAVLISFWATWCTPCKAEMPHLNRLESTYGGKGLVVLGINTDETRNRPKVQAEVTQRELAYTILLDPETEVLSDLNPSMNLPYSVLIGRDGKVAWTHQGFTPGDEVAAEAAVRAALGLPKADAETAAP